MKTFFLLTSLSNLPVLGLLLDKFISTMSDSPTTKTDRRTAAAAAAPTDGSVLVAAVQKSILAVANLAKCLTRLLYRLVIDFLATLVADVLEHPRVKDASAQVLVAGMNAYAEQPDLPQRAATLYLKMQSENEHISRQLGEQFPKVAANFIAGSLSAFKPKKNNNNHNNNNKIDRCDSSNNSIDEEYYDGESPRRKESDGQPLFKEKEEEKEKDNPIAEQWKGLVEKFQNKKEKTKNGNETPTTISRTNSLDEDRDDQEHNQELNQDQDDESLSKSSCTSSLEEELPKQLFSENQDQARAVSVAMT